MPSVLSKVGDFFVSIKNFFASVIKAICSGVKWTLKAIKDFVKGLFFGWRQTQLDIAAEIIEANPAKELEISQRFEKFFSGVQDRVNHETEEFYAKLSRDYPDLMNLICQEPQENFATSA